LPGTGGWGLKRDPDALGRELCSSCPRSRAERSGWPGSRWLQVVWETHRLGQIGSDDRAASQLPQRCVRNGALLDARQGEAWVNHCGAGRTRQVNRDVPGAIGNSSLCKASSIQWKLAERRIKTRAQQGMARPWRSLASYRKTSLLRRSATIAQDRFVQSTCGEPVPRFP